eukprot:TRINITY_DN2767_c0_g2_i1.p1 TRINITY_DN2767_c0_g2~~TRINITY_DN2767_c0_g2_i1.p1  ORF type:complete len:425 (+),score=106.97 TRINITY_DN2767_c0_g2_i1:467-1741(+)
MLVSSSPAATTVQWQQQHQLQQSPSLPPTQKQQQKQEEEEEKLVLLERELQTKQMEIMHLQEKFEGKKTEVESLKQQLAHMEENLLLANTQLVEQKRALQHSSDNLKKQIDFTVTVEKALDQANHTIEDLKLSLKKQSDVQLKSSVPSSEGQKPLPLKALTGSNTKTPGTITLLWKSTVDAEQPLTFTETIKAVKDYHPEGTCQTEISGKSALLGFSDEILKTCLFALPTASSAMKKAAAELGLTECHRLALLLYTHDVGISGNLDCNLYFRLNTDLRERKVKGKYSLAHKMRLWLGYLYYLFQALSLLPNYQGEVFRGIGIGALEKIKEEYTAGRLISWSSFTSSTSDQRVALENFAQGNGIMFRLQVVHGKAISKFSMVQTENEILLSPNSKFVVVHPLHKTGNGFYEVFLAEVDMGDPYRY